METRRVVEIRGVKFEVDTREAVMVHDLKVGDRVSVLLKRYGDTYDVHHGVVVGFEPFQTLPTIIVAYLVSTFDSGEIKLLPFNEKSADTEVVKSVDDVLFDKADALRVLDRKIEQAEQALAMANRHREYFLDHFGRYWAESEAK